MQRIRMFLMTAALFGQLLPGTLLADPASDRSSPAARPAVGKKNAALKTTVEIELLQDGDGSSQYAQQWLQLLDSTDITLQIHRASSNDRPEIKERTVGQMRSVTAVGRLSRSGKMIFPDRSFGLGDKSKLIEWVNELRTYGAQGLPAGRPLWGLTKDQFSTIYAGISKPIEIETDGIPISDLIAHFRKTGTIAIRWSDTTKTGSKGEGAGLNVEQELKHFSFATGFAVALRDHGLGFRPNRTPSGEIELLVENRNPAEQQWPVGWPLQRPKFKAAPKYFAQNQINLTDVALLDVFQAASVVTETPILLDHYEFAVKPIDLTKIKVSFPAKQANWSIAMDRMIMNKGMIQEMWQDEAGKCFVWITTSRGRRASNQDTDDSDR